MKQAITTTQQQPTDESVSVCGRDTPFRSKSLCTLRTKYTKLADRLGASQEASPYLAAPHDRLTGLIPYDDFSVPAQITLRSSADETKVVVS